MLTTSDGSSISRPYNAKLYIDKFTYGPIQFQHLSIGCVPILQPTISTLHVPRYDPNSKRNVTRDVLNRDDVIIRPPPTGYEGTVVYGDQRIPVNGELYCDLNKVTIGEERTNDMREWRDHERWPRLMTERDILSGFKTIGVKTSCKNKVWMSTDFYVYDHNPTAVTSGRNEAGPRCIDVKWDDQTRSLSRTYKHDNSLPIDLSIDENSTMPRTLKMIDNGLHWLELGYPSRLERVTSENEADMAQSLNDARMDLLKEIDTRWVSTVPHVFVGGSETSQTSPLLPSRETTAR